MGRTTQLECTAKLKDKKYVILYYANKSKELKFPLGIIASEDTFKDGKLMARYGNNYKELNLFIQNQKNRINNLIREGFTQNVNVIDYIKKELNRENVSNTDKLIRSSQTIVEAYKQYIERKRERDVLKISQRSFDRYASELKRLEEFDNKITLEKFDISYINKFVKWLVTPRTVTINVIDPLWDRNYTVTKTMKQTNATVKRFLDDLITFCVSIGKTIELDFPIEEMKDLRNNLTSASDNPDSIISMSLSELNAFRELRKTLKHKWKIDTYHAYMVGCLTGLRYSDIRLLSKNYINSENCIKMNLEKTDVNVTIPVREELMDILNYYDGSLVNRMPTIQRLNINLRKLLKRIDLFKVKEIEYTHVLKEKKQITVERWERFTFHSSRKTFISLSVKNGATYDQIKRWVGFQDFRTISFYMDSTKTNSNDISVLNF